jgi:hypothetical protein
MQKHRCGGGGGGGGSGSGGGEQVWVVKKHFLSDVS